MKPLIKGLKSTNRTKATTASAEPMTQTTSSARPRGNGHGGTTRNVVIEAKIDVGFGNTLYLRGEGEGLNWDQGIPLTCVDGSTWKWSGQVSDPLKFKLLINDSIWAKGEDMIAAPGQKIEISPAF